jgi:hypothetical protein
MSTKSNKAIPRRVAVTAIGWVLFGAVLWFVGLVLIEASREVDWTTVRPVPLWILCGVALYIGSLVVVDGLVRRLYGLFGVSMARSRGFVLYIVPTLGRYLPGKVLSLAGHVVIARRYGVDLSVSAAAVALLTVLGITGATLTGLFFLIIQPPGVLEQGLVRWTIAAGIGLIAFALHPRLWFRLVNEGLRLFGREPLVMSLNYGSLARLLLTMGFHVVLIVSGYAAMTCGVIGLTLVQLPILIGSICIANTLGFLAVFAPGGIGVREGVLLFLLSPTLGAGPAALFTVALRLVQIVVDTAAAAVGLGLLGSDKKQS